MQLILAYFDTHYNIIINLLQQYEQIVNILLTFLLLKSCLKNV
nr:MAG TPA: hypothetical protein [Caudoviricetes sp.]